MMESLRKRLFEPVDAAGLVFFRIVFGLLMAWDSARYVVYGWVNSHFVDPEVTLKFLGFWWVDPLPGVGMHAVFGIMAAAGACIALGAYYRASCALFFLGHTYAFLAAAEYYLNHGYLISTISFLMIFIPANRTMSADALRTESGQDQTVPRWSYGLIMAMMGFVYVYGAIAKMNPDWMSGEPVRHWLANRANSATPFIADLLRTEMVVLGVAYVGCFFDLLVVPGLLWKHTRFIAVFFSLCFHLSNRYLFNIGVFPWFSLLITTLFFEPDWPRRLPGELGVIVRDLLAKMSPGERGEPPEPPPLTHQKRVMAGLGLVMAIHFLLPLRHHLYPGEVAWNEEGHMFSWRMKLRNKQGHFTLRIVDKKTGRDWQVSPRAQLHDRQYRKAATRPDLLISYIHYLRDAYNGKMGMDVEIYADAFVALNYRKEQVFIDPKVDLAKVEVGIFKHNDWVTEFEDTALPGQVTQLTPGLRRSVNRIRVAANRAKRLSKP